MSTPPSGFLPAYPADQLAPGSVVGLTLEGVSIALVHQQGEFFALRDQCSHTAVALSEGEVQDATLECWLHGSCFDLRTGKPTSLPATEPVATYPTLVHEGQVYVNINQPSTIA